MFTDFTISIAVPQSDEGTTAMRLTSTGTSILAGPIVIATIDPKRAQAVMLAQGYRPIVAQEAAHGALSIEAARRLGRNVGLLLEEPR